MAAITSVTLGDGVYDESLVTAFYRDHLQPTFGKIPEQLDSLEVWQDELAMKDLPAPWPRCYMTVLISRHTAGEGDKARCDVGAHIVAGVAFEYYPVSNLCFINYLVVDEAHRGKGLGGQLIDTAEEVCNRVARHMQDRGGDPAGCLGVVLETNPVGAGEAPGSPSSLRHRWFHKLGFRRVDITYVQPPLKKDLGVSRGMHLLYRPSAVARQQLRSLAVAASQKQVDSVSTQTILRFMYMMWCSLVREMWKNESCGPGDDVEGELDASIERFRTHPLQSESTRPLLNLLKSTEGRDYLPLMGLPW